jgi:hypothetical protein
VVDHADDPYLRQLAIERAALDVRAAELDRQEAEMRRIAAEIRAGREIVARERSELDHHENHYRAFLDRQSGRVVDLLRPATTPSEPEPKTEAELELEDGRATRLSTLWNTEVTKVAYQSDSGLTNDEVKAALRKTPLSSELDNRDSIRRYYQTVTRLNKKGKIVYHNGRVFSPESYARFQRDLEAGLVDDERPIAKGHYSPMGEAIIEIASKSGIGLRRYDLTAELDKNPMFSETLAKHASVFYNTVAHLIKRGRLEKVGDIYRIPPDKFRKAAE